MRRGRARRGRSRCECSFSSFVAVFTDTLFYSKSKEWISDSDEDMA